MKMSRFVIRHRKIATGGGAMKLNIKQKLIIFTCGLFFLASIAFAPFFIHEGRKQVMATFEEQSRGMAQILAHGVVRHIHFNNISSLKERVQAALARPSVIHVGMFDSAGNLLSSSAKNKWIDAAVYPVYLPSESPTGQWKSTSKGNFLRVDGPFLLNYANIVGYLRIAFSSHAVNRAVKEIFEDSPVVTLVFLVVGCLGAVFTARNFSRPLFAVISAAQAIEAGNLSARAGVETHDELSDLGASSTPWPPPSRTVKAQPDRRAASSAISMRSWSKVYASAPVNWNGQSSPCQGASETQAANWALRESETRKRPDH
jgi:hypothetical protein